MSEQEIKLHVPRPARQSVERELSRGGATRIALQAMYFDTPQRELAGARIALRLRREGNQWVQTVKMPGADAITRMELNHPRPGAILDLSVYAGTELEQPLSALRGELGVRYETDVSRLLRKIRTREGTVEVAYDTGWLRAGVLALPIDELEFELVSGRPAAIFRLARTWQQRHRMIFDPRSKSERGDALAQTNLALLPGAPDSSDSQAGTDARRVREIARFWAPRGAGPVKLTNQMDPGQALACITSECLEQIARNAVVLSEADTDGAYHAGQPEHVHQLRVGIRRLRSAWRLFEGWAALPPDDLRHTLREYFAAFGANRDQDVQSSTVLPALRAAGMPETELPAAPAGDNARTLASLPGFQTWLLAMLEWNVTPHPAWVPPTAAKAPVSAGASPPSPQTPTIIPLTSAPVDHDLRARLMRRLKRWHKSVVQDGKRFAALSTEEKHAVRKRAKRLRYCLAFSESLLSSGRIRPYRKQLANVQDLLGEFNDLAVAHDQYAALSAQLPQAWFAVGWIAARQQALTVRAEAAFKRLANAPSFWK